MGAYATMCICAWNGSKELAEHVAPICCRQGLSYYRYARDVCSGQGSACPDTTAHTDRHVVYLFCDMLSLYRNCIATH